MNEVSAVSGVAWRGVSIGRPRARHTPLLASRRQFDIIWELASSPWPTLYYQLSKYLYYQK